MSRSVLVVAVVPLFRPTGAQVRALLELRDHVDHVVAVDDGSGADARLDELSSAVTLIRMHTNVGIARCLNAGVRRAREVGASHVLTLDQDSRLPTGYVSRAMAALDEVAEAGITCGGVGAGMIGPHRVPGAAIVGTVRDGLEGIQSGWVIPVAALDAIGEFDEGLFIDCVDVDWLMRASLAGRPIGVTDACVLDHALGSDERVLRVMGRRIAFSQHPPFRRYYITRNRVVMLRRYLVRRPRATLQQSIATIRITALGLVLGGGRRAQLVAVWAGLVHGIAGRRGRIPVRTRRSIERFT